MKTFLFLILAFPFALTAQKAKSTGLKSNYHYMRYAQDESLSAKYFALTITEHTSCGGLIRHRVMNTPLAAVDARTRLYVNAVPSQRKYFTQAKDLIHNLIAKKIPFTHFEVVASDIDLRKQTTRNAKKGGDGPEKYYLYFEGDVPVTVRATYKGAKIVETLDTNSNAKGAKILRFPMDFQFGAHGADIMPNGYPTEGVLLAAWKEYGKKAQMQWRDKAISEFLQPIFLTYKMKYITYEKFTSCKIYSDKNKKGGFDHLVDAAQLLIATLDEIDDDFKLGAFKKYWTIEYQNRISACRKTWKTFLEDQGMDLTQGDNVVSAEYKQKVFLNYLHSLMFTGQFDETERLIAENKGKKLKAGTLFDMRRIRMLNTQLKLEFDAHAEAKGWVRDA